MSTEQNLHKTPLVASADSLTPEELRRYSRHLSLPQIGLEGQRRLKNARVLVIGAGGLGSPALLYLAAAGVGTIGIVDDDHVDLPNLQRQVIHGVDTLGEEKVQSAAAAIARINPLVTVIPHPTRLTTDNALGLIESYDLVVDGADNFATRYIVSDACTLTNTPCVWGSILRFEGRLSVFWNSPAHDGISYRDLHPHAPAPGVTPSCSTAGVLGALPGTIGALMSSEAIKLITGCGDTLYGRLVIHDGLTAQFRELRILPDPDAPLVTSMEGGATTACSATRCTSQSEAQHLTVSPPDLQQQQNAGAVLIDVREPWERDISTIPGAIAIPLVEFEANGAAALPAKAQGHDVIFYCASGQRSAQALDAVAVFFAAREETASHLSGGIQAWISELHPELLSGPR